MKYTGIAQTGERLLELLQREMVPEAVSHAKQIGLCAPPERGDYLVGIWLYDIRECAELRSHRMVTLDSERQRYPSTYVNLYYMITAYSDGDIKYRARQEAQMLGKIIQTLKDAAVIDGGGMSGGREEPASQIVQLDLPMEDKLRIYHVPDGSYKTSLFYEIGPVELESEKEHSVRRVVDVSYTLEETKPRRVR